jgi:short-chain 2-methylacyl-CoA dehydrogenase
MAFELSPEHEAFRQVVRDFAQAEIAPFAADWDARRHFPVETVRAMGKLGLFGITVPEEYGGSGGDFEAAVGLGIGPIMAWGTPDQKSRWLPALAAGEALAGFGLTEAEAGSDAAATRTRAVLDGDTWVINGSKQFITNSGRSRRSSPSPRAPARLRTGARRSQRSSSLPERLASSSNPPTTSSAGTPPTHIR